MKSYDVVDMKGNYLANFIYSGDAIGYCHVKGLPSDCIVIKTKECNCNNVSSSK